MLEIHVRLPSGCRSVLWPGTIAQKQHETPVQETLQGNVAFALGEAPLDRGEQAAISRARRVGTGFTMWEEIRPSTVDWGQSGGRTGAGRSIRICPTPPYR